MPFSHFLVAIPYYAHIHTRRSTQAQNKIEIIISLIRIIYSSTTRAGMRESSVSAMKERGKKEFLAEKLCTQHTRWIQSKYFIKNILFFSNTNFFVNIEIFNASLAKIAFNVSQGHLTAA